MITMCCFQYFKSPLKKNKSEDVYDTYQNFIISAKVIQFGIVETIDMKIFNGEIKSIHIERINKN